MGYQPTLIAGFPSPSYGYYPWDANASSRRVCVECTMPVSGQWQEIRFFNGSWSGTRGNYYDFAVYTANDSAMDPRGTLLRSGTMSFPDGSNAVAAFSSPISVSAGERYVFEMYPNASFTTSNWVRWNATRGGIDRAWYSTDSGSTWISYYEWADQSALYAVTIDGTLYDRRQPTAEFSVAGDLIAVYATATNSYRCGNRLTVKTPWLLYRVHMMSLRYAGTPPNVRVAVYGQNGLIAASLNSMRYPVNYRDAYFRFTPTVIPAGDVAVVLETVAPPDGDANNRTTVPRAIIPAWLQSPWFLQGSSLVDVASATASALTVTSLNDFTIDTNKHAMMGVYGFLLTPDASRPINLGGGFTL